MRVGIIAAGWGERLGQERPKALTPVGGRKLIDFVLDGLEAMGATAVTCIVNESAREVVDYVAQSGRRLPVDWIVQTTPSSMHSFLIVLERLAQTSQAGYVMTTVDSVCPASVYQRFAAAPALFPEADVILGLTRLVDDEKPLRVAMRGNDNTGLMPDRVEENPSAYEIVALTNHGFESEFVTSGFYWIRARALEQKAAALAGGYQALRQYLGHLLKYGYRFFGMPLPPVVDVDRPQDIATAEKLLQI
jgi:NDP-sugar pyrophosphorylase family protein